MKRKQLLFNAIIVVLAFILMGTSCEKDNEVEEVEQLSNDVSELSISAVSFIESAISYETKAISATTPVEEVEEIFNDFITAGELFVENVNLVTAKKTVLVYNDNLKTDPVSCVLAPTGLFDVSGLSPAAVKALADIIKNTKDEHDALMKARESGAISEEEYNDLANQLRKRNNLEAINWGASGMVGVLTAGTVAGAKIAAAGTVGVGAIMTAPALITIGAIGATATYVSYKVFSWYSKSNKDGEEYTFFSAFQWELDTPFPVTMIGQDAKVVISFDGYAPILLENILFPTGDNDLRIEVDLKKVSDLKSGQASTTEVCYFHPPRTIGQNCDMIFFVTGQPDPPNPAAGQGVTVTGTLLPRTEGCDIHFSIIGTDGYSNSAQKITNDEGFATFYIPGASPGVFDKVTITAGNGAQSVVSYYFAGSGDDKNLQPVIRR